jgi:hypothetical protein
MRARTMGKRLTEQYISKVPGRTRPDRTWPATAGSLDNVCAHTYYSAMSGSASHGRRLPGPAGRSATRRLSRATGPAPNESPHDRGRVLLSGGSAAAAAIRPVAFLSWTQAIARRGFISRFPTTASCDNQQVVLSRNNREHAAAWLRSPPSVELHTGTANRRGPRGGRTR